MGWYPATAQGPLIAAALAGQTVSSLTLSGATLTGTTQSSGILRMTGSGSGYGSAAVGSNHVLTPSFANGTAGQLSDTLRDYLVYLVVGTAGTAFTVAIGPTSTPAETIVPSSTATSGEVVSFRLPAAWYVEWSATTATLASQLAIGC